MVEKKVWEHRADMELSELVSGAEARGSGTGAARARTVGAGRRR